MKISDDGKLPSLPQVVLRALEACRGDSDYRAIARIIRSDTALTARALSLANSSLYGRVSEVTDIGQALLRLGMIQIESVIVIASLRQLLLDLGEDDWQQLRNFWRHSLTTALIARALARLTRYDQPEEAFMVGILHNVGELFSISSSPREAPQALLDNQTELGARLAENWGLGQMATDAIRLQQAAPREIHDASHLAKLINVSTRLARFDSGGVDAAQTLLGFTSALTHEICSRIDREVGLLAHSLDISLEDPFSVDDARRRLFSEVVQSAMVDSSVQSLTGSESITELLTHALSSLATLTGRSGLVFSHHNEALQLVAATHGSPPDLLVAANPPLSLLTRTATAQDVCVFDNEKPTALDRQMLGLVDSRCMMCVPIRRLEQCYGVLVVGLDAPAEADSHRTLVSLLAHRLADFASDLEMVKNDPPGPSADQLAQQIELRKRVHEVNNPLAIVRQYIHQLQQKLGKLLGSEVVDSDLGIVREELDRAAGLLERISEIDHLSMASSESDNNELVLNDELDDLCDLFQEALFLPNGINCARDFTASPTRVSVSRGPLRQLVMNLIRNAVEAIDDGGRISLRTDAPVWQGQRQWVELSIEDSGDGMPESVRNALFRPVRSSKGPGHSGLGLSIVKQLVDDMRGVISCRTGKDGTCFRILLPMATGDGTGE